MKEDLLERAKKALIGRYFIIMHEGLAYFGEITNVRLFREKYVIEIRWSNDSTRRVFYYSEEDMEVLLAYGICTREDNKVTYIFYSEAKFISCLCKQVIGAKTEHTAAIDVWKQRWWEEYSYFAKDNSRDWNERKIATNEFIERAMKEMDGFFKDK